MKGRFDFKKLDKDGRILKEWSIFNEKTIVGLNDMLTTQFLNGTKKTVWTIGLIENTDSFPILSPDDTMASHTNWTECTAYNESPRPGWTPTTPAGGSIYNVASANFTMNATKSIFGAFLVSGLAAPGNTGGILFATAANDTPEDFVATQIFQVTYTIDMSTF